MEQDKQASSKAIYVKRVGTKALVVKPDTSVRGPYKVKRIYAVYKGGYHDMDSLIDTAYTVMDMDETGDIRQPSHAANKKLRAMVTVFYSWFDYIFPNKNYKIRPDRDQVLQVLRLRQGDLISVLGMLNTSVIEHKESSIPIDRPIQWCRGVVEKKIIEEVEYERSLMLEVEGIQQRQLEQPKIVVTEVPQPVTNQLTEQVGANQVSDSKPTKEQAEQALNQLLQIRDQLAKDTTLTPEQRRERNGISMYLSMQMLHPDSPLFHTRPQLEFTCQ